MKIKLSELKEVEAEVEKNLMQIYELENELMDLQIESKRATVKNLNKFIQNSSPMAQIETYLSYGNSEPIIIIDNDDSKFLDKVYSTGGATSLIGARIFSGKIWLEFNAKSIKEKYSNPCFRAIVELEESELVKFFGSAYADAVLNELNPQLLKSSSLLELRAKNIKLKIANLKSSNSGEENWN